MSDLFKKIREHRSLILACEAIGWLHMAGKAKVEFLKQHGGEDNKYEYKNWYPFEKNLLDNVKNKFNQQNVCPKDMAEFFTEHTNKGSGILGLLQAAHGIVSGVEKNIPGKTSEYLNQTKEHMWLSSAFGKPEKNLLGDSPELTENTWVKLMEEVKKILTELQTCADKNELEKWEDWEKWRTSSIVYLLAEFTETLAETRIPNNDVTLWDQSYVAASLFKSSVVGAILEGASFPWKIKDKNGTDKPNDCLKQETQWRLLTVGIGTEHYESRAVKIGDWTGAQQAIKDFFEKVCNLIEVNLAVGCLLYQDSEVLVFSFPGERIGETADVLKIKELEDAITQEIDKEAQKANFEIPPYCKISEKPSRSLVCMTEEIKTAKKIMAVPIHRTWQMTGSEEKEGHVCPVCLVRRNGKSKKGALCSVCKGRKDKRRKNWLEKKDGNTIWIGEVADANDRLALVIMSLDIEPWLDGRRLNSLRAQAIAEWSTNSGLKQNPITTDKAFSKFLEYAQKKLKTNLNPSDNVFSTIHEGFKDETEWSVFFEKIVEDRAEASPWDPNNNDQNARWLTHQLFRKLPSPGRVYRFQRQAKEFFETLLKEFKCQNTNPWRAHRFILKPDDNNVQGWEDGQVYNSHFDDAPLDLLYRKSSNDFLTVSNLAKIENPKERLKGEKLKLTTDEDDGSKAIKELCVQSVEEVTDALATYRPIIPLEISPVRFRVLVPLEDASGFIDTAIEKWQTEFSRVWDRLPLRVGVIACKRKTPFQSVIEMARTLEEELKFEENPEEWKIEKCVPSLDETKLTFIRQDNLQEEQTVPLKFEDGRDDVFYPYFAVKDTECSKPLDFQHPDDQVYRHVKDLKSGNHIKIYPSRIATVFMDDTAVRFEKIKPYGLMDWKRMRGVWKELKENVKSQTALRGAWAEIAERRIAWESQKGWKEEWLDFVRTVIATRLKIKDEALNTLVQMAKDDLLEWVLDWHITVLKEKITEDKS